MLGLGFWEVVILGILALVVIGPEQLPDFAKSVAKFLNEIKRTTSDLKNAFEEEKDIFKENIDQLQQLKKDIESLPQLDEEQELLKYEQNSSTETSSLDSNDQSDQLDLFQETSHDQASSAAHETTESSKVKD